MSTLNATLVDIEPDSTDSESEPTSQKSKNVILNGEVIGKVEFKGYGDWHACLRVETDHLVYPFCQLVQGHGDTPEAAIKTSFINSITGYEQILEEMKSLKSRIYSENTEGEQ